MKLKLDDFRSVSFHDSTLLKIEERPEYIRMEINTVCVRLPINDSEGKVWTLYDCSLECFGVSKNEKAEWDDTRSAKPPSDPSLPIDEILDTEVKGDFLELAGFTRDKNWGVWRFIAQTYELNWKTQEEFKRD